MATFHVIYDPTDRIRVGEHFPKGVKFIAMKCDDIDDREDVAAIARELSELLLKQFT